MGSLATVFPDQPPKFEPHVTISTNIALDMDNAKDNVNLILSACSIAMNSLPNESRHDEWVRLGKVTSQRAYFKKLYFLVIRDATLISFSRIVREQFVCLPRRIELAEQAANPQCFHKNSQGNLVRKKSVQSRPRLSSSPEKPKVAIDMDKIRQELAQEAAQWTIEEFEPHLSLVYSKLHPIDNALWRTIRTRVSDYLSIDNCDLDHWNVEGNGFSWAGGTLKLMLCEGDVCDWMVLGSVDLHV